MDKATGHRAGASIQIFVVAPHSEIGVGIVQLQGQVAHRMRRRLGAARRGAYTWIDAWYNARRRHSSIGYLSPLQYEAQLARQADQTALQAA